MKLLLSRLAKLIFKTIEGLPPKDYNPSIKSNDSNDISLPKNLLAPYLIPDPVVSNKVYNFLILLIVIQVVIYLFLK